MQSAISFKAIKTHVAEAPLEANNKVGIAELQIWWHLIPNRIARIPIVDSSTRNKEMNPLGGVVDQTFQIHWMHCEVNCGFQEILVVLESAVTPFSDEGVPSVLLILVGLIW
jgi:hypothetical protein